MAQESDEHVDDLLKRMSDEFGPRRPREGEQEEPPPLPIPQREPRFASDVQQVPPRPPVRLRLPRQRPVAVWVLLTVNILMYVLSVVLTFLFTRSGGLLSPASSVLRLLGWKENALIEQGQYWRLITATFLHGNLLHIFFNGYALYALGPETERLYGTPRFVAMYFVSGLAGSVASYALSSSPSVGASGAIFGLFGALISFYFLGRGVLGELSRTQLQSMAGIIFINLLIGFSAQGSIDNFAHLGGLVGGAIAGWLLSPRYEVDTRLYPPVLVQRYLPIGWLGILALTLLLSGLVWVIKPPL